MQFDPAIFTKEEILNSDMFTEFFARNSPEFATSLLACDIDVLSLKVHGESLKLRGDKSSFYTIAHILAQHQKIWMNSEAASNKTILKLNNSYNTSVAHHLARYQPEWIDSFAACDPEILKLSDNYDSSVAHELAQNPKWLLSEAAKNKSLLKLKNGFGSSVAHELAKHPQWLNSEESRDLNLLKITDLADVSVALLLIEHPACLTHEPLYDKSLLTLVREGKTLAEHLLDKYPEQQGNDIQTIAMKLIAQGAAYKHSKTMNLNIGQHLLFQTESLMSESTDPLVSLKYSLALYSTIAHCIDRNRAKKLVNEEAPGWMDILQKAELKIIGTLEKNPALWDVDLGVEPFCEPADALVGVVLVHLKNKNTLNSLSINDVPSSDVSEETIVKNAIY
jgi:hypothetical protein